MVLIKTKEEIEIMARAGKIAGDSLREVLAAVRPGITTLELERIAEKAITKRGAIPSFRMVEDYDFATCININEGLVHGLPGDYKIKKGDLVSIDMGAYFNGFHSDLSYTIEVETSKETDFLETGKKALKAGIAKCKPGNRIGDISNAMQKIVEKAGYTVSRDLVGHGIGRDLHEDPYIPGYGRPGKGLEIKVGMVFAVEIIYQKGQPEIIIGDDDWTILTADGSLAGLFEHTVAVTGGKSRVLTQ